MTVPVLCDIQDLIDVWRAPVDEDENNQCLRLIEKATAMLIGKAPWVLTRIAAGTLEPLIVAGVLAQVVKRFVTNPSGASSESVGPYSASFIDRYEGADGSAAIRGGLQITKSDLDALRPYLSRRQKAGSIRTPAGLAPIRVGGYSVEPAELNAADPDGGFPFGSVVDGAEVVGFRSGHNDSA